MPAPTEAEFLLLAADAAADAAALPVEHAKSNTQGLLLELATQLALLREAAYLSASVGAKK